MQRMSPFRLMNTVFLGLAISLAYGLLSSALLYFLEGKPEFQLFLAAYTTSFKTLISLGLILGTALVVSQSQNVIPQTIEAAFTDAQLSETNYFFYKRRFISRRRSMTFAAEFIVVGFVIFSYCQFPLPGLAEALMIIPACAEYAFGVYVGRKLCYAGLMLHSLLGATVTRNLFKKRELDQIDSYVHIVSTLTVIFVYVHVLGYFEGPFLYQSALGKSIRIFLLLPALIATPVLLIFNFYPRVVLRALYSQSIDVEVKKLQEALQSEAVSSFEKRSYLVEFDKMSRDELRNSLQLTLSDLPIGITILIMVLEPLLRK
jgi:hypothetical protein